MIKNSVHTIEVTWTKDNEGNSVDFLIYPVIDGKYAINLKSRIFGYEKEKIIKEKIEDAPGLELGSAATNESLI